MLTDAYCRFTNEVADTLTADLRVIGIVALGSTAEKSHLPDVWSDHDLFVIVKSGEQEAFRSELSWLPDHGKIVFSFRDTPHAVKVLYDSGHLVEAAVFDLEELRLARVNDYRVLLDRGGVVEAMTEVHEATHRWVTASKADDRFLWGEFMAGSLLAASRAARGETISAKSILLGTLKPFIALIRANVPSRHPERLDDLDVFRRFEFAYPSLGSEVNTLLESRLEVAARELAELARRELRTSPDYPAAAMSSLLGRLRSIEVRSERESAESKQEMLLDPYDVVDIFRDA